MAIATNQDEAREILKAGLAEKQLREFIPMAWQVVEPGTDFISNWHIDAICEHLEAVTNGDIKRLCINIPPGYCKSRAVTIMWPCWEWIKKPHMRYLCASYAEKLAIDHNVERRTIIQSEWYQRHWGHIVEIEADDNQKSQFTNTRKGKMMTTGVGGTATGRGGECLPYGAIIETEIGGIKIGDLFSMESPPRVLSFNHKDGRLEYKKIQAKKRTLSRRLFEIETSGGRRLRVTGGHPVYTEEYGYRKAELLTGGERLKSIEVKVEQEVLDLRRRKGGSRRKLHEVLQVHSSHPYSVEMPSLQSSIRATSIRNRKGSKEGSQGLLLLSQMLEVSPRRKKQFKQQVQGMRRKKTSRELLLLGCLSGEKQSQENGGESRTKAVEELPGLRRSISGKKLSAEVLRKIVRGQGSLRENEGSRKLEIQERQELREAVSRDARSYPREGRSQVRGLRSAGEDQHSGPRKDRAAENKHGYPSHRRGPNEQQTRKLDNGVLVVPHHSPQVGQDSIRLVQELRGEEVFVYDLQVEENHNFFAEGILVHNCLICDDPINPKQAASDVELESCNRWFGRTFQNRLRDKKNGAIVVVMQRLHEKDTTAQAIANGYEHLMIPAEYDPKRSVVTCIGWKDPRTKKGDLLWPEREDVDEIEFAKRSMGSYAYAGQYQQSPHPDGGGVFKREDFRYYTAQGDYLVHEATRLSPFDMYRYSTIDLAFSKSDSADWTVVAVWGFGGGFLWLLDLLRARLSPKELADQIRVLENKWRYSLNWVEKGAYRKGQQTIDYLEEEGIGVRQLGDAEGAYNDKYQRAMNATPRIESHKVLFPSFSSWLSEYEGELLLFPNGSHDDQVDVTAYGIACAPWGGVGGYEFDASERERDHFPRALNRPDGW